MKTGPGEQKQQLAKCRWQDRPLVSATPTAKGFRLPGRPAAPEQAVALATRLAKTVSGVLRVTDTDSPLYPLAVSAPPGLDLESAFRAALGIADSAPLRLSSIAGLSHFLHDEEDEPVEEYFGPAEVQKISTATALLKENLTDLQNIRFHESLVVTPEFWLGRGGGDTLVGLYALRVDSGGAALPQTTEFIHEGEEALERGDAAAALEIAGQHLPSSVAHDLRARALFALRREEELADINLYQANPRLQDHGRRSLISRLQSGFTGWLQNGPFAGWLGDRFQLGEVEGALPRGEVVWTPQAILLQLAIRRPDGEWELVLELQPASQTVSWVRLLPPLAATALRDAARASAPSGQARELNIAAFRCFQAGLADYAWTLVERALQLDPDNPQVQANHSALSAKQIPPTFMSDRFLASLA